MSPGEWDVVHDCGVACRQIAGLLDTVVDALPSPSENSTYDGQIIDSLTAIGRLAKHTSERLAAVAV